MDQTHEVLKMLPDALLPWYEVNKRDLPWRNDKNPYHIWLSEVMLQQTRVEAVKDYYLRFIKAIPSVNHLSRVDDEVLNKLWEGLGYYSRARNLKKAAVRLVNECGGTIPADHDYILQLPGVGRYTAGAICSIAFNMRTPAVDGNVMRVISRILDDDTPIDIPAHRKWMDEKLKDVYPENSCDFTQALMELGATVCGPNKKPECDKCPCCSFCTGKKNGREALLPARLPKRKRRIEEYTVYIIKSQDKYALRKRNDGLLAGLWEFPNTMGKVEPQNALVILEKMGLKPSQLFRVVERKHIFTHIEWSLRGFYVETQYPEGDFTWFTAEQIRSQAALPTAFRQFWEEIDNV